MSDSGTFKSFPRTNPQIGWAVDLRKNHRRREAFVRGAGGTFAILGIVLTLISVVRLSDAASAYQEDLLRDVVELLLGVSSFASGIGLSTLKPWSRGAVIGGALLSLVVAVLHWQLGAGAVAAYLYVLALTGGKAGKEMLSFTYSQAIKITPALDRWVGVVLTHMIVTGAGVMGAILTWMAKRGCP